MKTILKYGFVVDPRNNIFGEKDVAILNDKIYMVADHIVPEKWDRVIDCKDLQIWPGLVDIHLHIGDLFEVTTNSIYCAAQDGVTTAMSPGAGNTLMAPALLGAEMDRGLPLNAGVFLGAPSILSTLLSNQEYVDLFLGKLPSDITANKMTYNPITNQTAPFIMGIKDHVGHFILSDQDIERVFEITSESYMMFASHTQHLKHSYRLAKLSHGRPFHLSHTNAIGSQENKESKDQMEKVLQLCKEPHITGEFVTTMLRENLGNREGLKVSEKVREICLRALEDKVVDILVSDGQNQSTMKGFGDTRDNIPCILELAEQGVLSLSDAVATMTSNPTKLIAKRTKNPFWMEEMGHLGEGAYANITIVDPKNKRATYVIVNGTIVSFESRIVRSYGNAGYWMSKFGVKKSLGVGQLPMYYSYHIDEER